MTRDELWQRVYDAMVDAYVGELRDYDVHDAAASADAAAEGWYTGGLLRSPRRRRLSGLRRMPAPGPLLNLTPGGGAFLGVEFVDGRAIVGGSRWGAEDRIPLWWSEDLKALLVFSQLGDDSCRFPPTLREDQLSRMWAQGRPARCSGRAPGRPALPFVFPAIQTSYRSDKFKPRRLRPYIHHHGPGVRAYFSESPFSGPPRVTMIRGGKLRLTSHGIAG